MLKRNIAILIAGGLLSAQVNLAAADQGAFPMSADEQGRGVASTLPAQAKYFAQREASIRAEAQGDVRNTIKVSAFTKNITVEHLSTVKIVNDKGQSFAWTCDAPGEHVVPLKAIAPAGFEAGDITIYVRHPAAHIPG